MSETTSGLDGFCYWNKPVNIYLFNDIDEVFM